MLCDVFQHEPTPKPSPQEVLSAKVRALQKKSPPAKVSNLNDNILDPVMVIDNILGKQEQPDSCEMMCLALAAGLRQIPHSLSLALTIKYASILNHVEARNALR